VPKSGIAKIGLILTKCMIWILYIAGPIGCNLPKCVKSMSKFGGLPLQNDYDCFKNETRIYRQMMQIMGGLA
jgi:hypothetical protein